MNRNVLNGALIIVLTHAENEEIELSIFSAMVGGHGEGQWSMVAAVIAHLEPKSKISAIDPCLRNL
jgi:hypothetical protein